MDVGMALKLVKARLNKLSTPDGSAALDPYLEKRIEAKVQELAGNGITVGDTADDLLLVVDGVVWDYQNRDKSTGMPEWLRLKRRERWLKLDDP